jgi:uncharacterized protein (DUF2147 family)
MDGLKKRVIPGTIASAVMLAILCTASLARADADSIIGIWNESDNDAQFEIYKCASFYCGKIHSLREPNAPQPDSGSPGLPRTDCNNPEPTLRNRPMVGLPFMSGFEYEGHNTWKGKIYNPDDGKSYNCRLSMAGPNRLQVRGYVCIPLLGKTVTWTRAD